MHLFVIPFWFNVLVTEAVVLIAFWKGGWRERTVAGVHQVNALLSYACVLTSCPLQSWDAPRGMFVTVDLVTDGAILAACLICAARSDRYWPIWASAFALARIASDLLAFQPGVTLWASLSANLIWRYLIDACIVWGVWSYQRQRRQMALTKKGPWGGGPSPVGRERGS